MSQKNILLLVRILILVIAVSLIVVLLIQTSPAPNYIEQNTLILNEYEFTFLHSVPGNSGSTVLSKIMFELDETTITLRSYNGLEGRNMVTGQPGTTINEGSQIPFFVKGISQFSSQFPDEQNESFQTTYEHITCQLTQGDGNFCEEFMSEECAYSCTGKITIHILEPYALNACLSELSKNCTFNNGEVIQLVDTIHVSQVT
ncbi:MAG: hypothetical protein ACMXYF_03645 [Candidatus Woesearchaeota archaeon]